MTTPSHAMNALLRPLTPFALAATLLVCAGAQAQAPAPAAASAPAAPIDAEKQKQIDRILSYGSLGNYSLAGFEMVLHRYVSHYIITYYLPSGWTFFSKFPRKL